LRSTAHYLHLLAELSQPEILHPDRLILHRGGLAHCFTQLADTADQIAANTIQTARRRKPAQPG